MPAGLARPAQAEFNRIAYTEIADLLDRYPTKDATKRYPQTRTYQTVHNSSPAAAASLLGQLTRPRAAENSATGAVGDGADSSGVDVAVLLVHFGSIGQHDVHAS